MFLLLNIIRHQSIESFFYFFKFKLLLLKTASSMQRRKSETAFTTQLPYPRPLQQPPQQQPRGKKYSLIHSNHPTKKYSINDHPQISKQPSTKKIQKSKQASKLTSNSTSKLKGQYKNKTSMAISKDLQIKTTKDVISMKNDLKNLIRRNTTSKGELQSKANNKPFKMNKSNNPLAHFISQNTSRQFINRDQRNKQKDRKVEKKEILQRKSVSNNTSKQGRQQKKGSKLKIIKEEQNEESKFKEINIKSKEERPYKATRYSLDCNPVGVQKLIIEEALKIKPKKYQKVKREDVHGQQKQKPNFMELFKNYKKNFDISYIKMSKNGQKDSSKNNSSSLTTSIYPFQSSKPQQKAYNNEIIKDQINHNLMASIPQHLNSHKTYQNSDNSPNQFPLLKKFKKTILIDNPKKPGTYQTVELVEKRSEKYSIFNENIKEESFSQQINQEEVSIYQNKQKIIQFQLYHQQQQSLEKNVNNEEKTKENFLKENNSQFPSKQNTTTTEEPLSEQSKMQKDKSFKDSKYYVQPIPTFKNQKDESLSESSISKEDLDSFLGYEMEQIEKNIIVDTEFEL